MLWKCDEDRAHLVYNRKCSLDFIKKKIKPIEKKNSCCDILKIFSNKLNKIRSKEYRLDHNSFNIKRISNLHTGSIQTDVLNRQFRRKLNKKLNPAKYGKRGVRLHHNLLFKFI